MKRFVMVTAAAVALAAASGVARAQDAKEGGFIRNSTFSILPSALSTNVISAPDGVDSHTAFNARFQGVISTSTPWLAFVGGAQWGPAKDEDHGPIIFLGGIIPIVPLNQATNGILSFSIDPLLVATAPGGDGMDFVMEGAVVLGIGKMMMPQSAYWSGVGAFFLLDQNITVDEDPVTGEKDRWNPALIYGISLPIAP